MFCVFSGEATNTNFYSLWFVTTGAWTHDLPYSIDNTMAKRKRTNHDLQNTTRKTKNCATRISLKKGRDEDRCSERVSSSYSTSAVVALLLLLSLQTQWYVMNEERTGLWLHQKEHICGHLWHRYYVAANQVMVVIDINETCFDQMTNIVNLA
jgi:hypothetical protein